MLRSVPNIFQYYQVINEPVYYNIENIELKTNSSVQKLRRKVP